MLCTFQGFHHNTVCYTVLNQQNLLNKDGVNYPQYARLSLYVVNFVVFNIVSTFTINFVVGRSDWKQRMER